MLKGGKRRWAYRMIRWFCLAFSLSFIWLGVHIAVGGFYEYGEARLLLWTAAALRLLGGLWRLTGRCADRLERRSRAIRAGFLALMLALQMGFGLALRYRPIFDIDAVYGGAVEWAETGTFASYYEYYAYFYNNFGGLRLLAAVFRAYRRLGGRDYFLAATGFNCALSLGTMCAAGSAGRRLAGVRGEVMLYGFFLLSPPFYFIAPAFYTDALSMPFPVLLYRLYLMVRDAEDRRVRLALYGLMGFTAALGASIKPTVLIAFAAIVLDGLLTWDPKRAAAMLAAGLAVFALCRAESADAFYRHVDRQTAAAKATPVLHWVMMGLRGEGMYNPEDYDFTRSFDDPAARSAALEAEIVNRVRALGPDGLFRLMTRKGDICFGDGTYGLSDCLGGERERDNLLHELLLSGGRYHETYRHACGGALMAVYVLMIASGLEAAFQSPGGDALLTAPRLAVFGLLAFLCCWEARWRYFSNFAPLLFLCALPGAEGAVRRMGRALERLRA